MQSEGGFKRRSKRGKGFDAQAYLLNLLGGK
jgi:hypothetical protein